MIADLKSYPAMKDSGVEWLGEVPEHWEVERGKSLFTKVERPVRESDEVVTCFRDGIVTLRKHRRTQGFTESLKEIGYQGIRAGDLVVHAMDAFAGAVGVADSDGKGTPVYAVCQPRSNADAHYHAFVIREMAGRQWILALSTGIRERSTDFRFGTYACQRVPLPPLPEQAGIVRYLDHVDRRVRRYVWAKHKLIGLPEEQKQAIIHRAVTRGLDRDVPLKDSGVEWLGAVPEHWEVRRADSLYREIDERSVSGSEELMSVSHKTGVTPRKKSVTMFLAESNVGHKICRPGDLAINTMWAYMAALGVARQTGIVSPSYGVYRPIDPEILDPDYIDCLLRTEGCKSEYLCRSTGITSSRLRLYPDAFLRIPILCPPGPEQVAIAHYLRDATSDVQAGIKQTEREIELLREYRIRLIADVVTGRLDVREAAARLPEEPDEPEPLSETDAFADAEEAPAEDLDGAPVETET